MEFKDTLDIDCYGKSIKQKKILWNIFKKWGYRHVCIEDGMFVKGDYWYDARYFLVCNDKCVHPRGEKEPLPDENNNFTYDSFMSTHCSNSWRERYTGKSN